jgi:hypothetical protein
MSEIIISDALGNLSRLPEKVEDKATQLPKPAGYHILCMVPQVDEEYDSGLIKSAVTQQHEEILTPVLFVMDIGPDAYLDKERFPTLY